MKISFLGQGLESESENAVGNYLMKFLAENQFHTFKAISAFASQTGVFGLSKLFKEAKKKLKNITIVVGIDQGGTSKEALEELLGMGVDSYIFYYREQPIFHPKIYLFEGESEVKLMIGSSNLTGGGLFTNVETSVLFEFAPADKEGSSLLQQLNKYYKTLFDHSDPNLHKISKETIANFVDLGIVPDELTRQRNSRKDASGPLSSIDDKMASLIKSRKVPAIPGTFPRKPRVYDATKKGEPAIEVSVEEVDQRKFPKSGVENGYGNLVWTSGPLTERHLNVPKGKNTNITGSMLFGKGLMEDIDQRHYFRDEVFANLPWLPDQTPRTAHLERTTAFFTLVVEGITVGRYPMRLTHNTDRNSKSYKQANSMTSISWGEAKKFIARDELIGKSAELYRNDNLNEFTLVIE